MRHAICDQNKKKQVGTFPHYAHSFLFALNFTTYGIFDFLPAHCLRLYKGHCNAGRLLTAMRSRRRFDLTATAKDGNTRSIMMMKHMFLLRDNFFSCEDSWKALIGGVVGRRVPCVVLMSSGPKNHHLQLAFIILSLFYFIFCL